MTRIYVASSWRNPHQQTVVALLRAAGHEVYDFRHPPHGKGGFAWSDLDEGWQDWSAEDFRERLLNHPIAAHGFLTDKRAMDWCDTCVLVMPCGRSAHMELGWAAGAGKRAIVLLAGPAEPELMYLLATDIATSTDELLRLLPPAKAVA